MAKPEKIEAVAELKEQLQKYPLVIMTKYVGINADQSESLRKKLRTEQVRLKVYKNTLARRALTELGLAEAGKFMMGPTGWAFSKDPVAASRVLKDFNKEVPLVEMVGGILDGKVVSKAELIALASLPPRDVLIAQVAGTIAAPLRNLLGALTALPRNLAYALDQVKSQKEGAGATA